MGLSSHVGRADSVQEHGFSYTVLRENRETLSVVYSGVFNANFRNLPEENQEEFREGLESFLRTVSDYQGERILDSETDLRNFRGMNISNVSSSLRIVWCMPDELHLFRIVR
jgi:hypothetical protein